MKTGCHCGATIFDNTDDLPQKGHLIPDQEWFATYDAMDDEVIIPLSEGAIDKEKAFHLSRGVISPRVSIDVPVQRLRRLYIDDIKGAGLHCYVPSDDATSKEILRSRDGRSET